MTNTTNKRRTNFFQPISQKVLLFLLTLCFMGGDFLNTYAQTVTQEWVARYNGPDSLYDQAIAVDIINGCLYVTGSSYSTSTNNDITTIKYDRATGNELWVRKYNGSANGADIAVALEIDKDCNVVVIGTSQNDIVTIKYDQYGIQQWVQRYNGPANSGDAASGLAIDDSNNVYVTGRSVGIGTNTDYVTIKYSPSGVQQWVNRYNGTANSADAAAAITLDTKGNIYVTGGSIGTGTNWDYVTVKYSPSGVQQWTARYNGANNEMDSPVAIATDSNDNIIVTGTSSLSSDEEFATVKYSSSGIQQWVQIYNNPLTDDKNRPFDLAVDNSGNSYVTGLITLSVSPYNTDYIVIKYDTAGNQQWSKTLDGPANSWDWPLAMTLDANNNVYVTGMNYNLTDPDFATVKYNTDGVEQWVQRDNGPASGDDVAYSVAVDADYNVYITGLSAGTGTNYDFATIKYSQLICNLSLTFTKTDESCNGVADGSINLTVTSGTLPYNFLWSNGATTEDISGLTANTYTVIVTDSLGCTKEDTVTINELQPAQSSRGPVASCSELFMSEYTDGSKHNKAVELFNPTDQPLALNRYFMRVYMNGAPTPLVTQLTGIVPAKSTHVVTHPNADAPMLAKANQTSNKLNFNGDDPIQIVKVLNTEVPDMDTVEGHGGNPHEVLNQLQLDTIDQLGTPGVYPGNKGYAVAGATTKNTTLIRKSNVTGGQVDWSCGQNQWNVQPQDSIGNLGTCQGICKSLAAIPTVNFVTTSSSYDEKTKEIKLEVELTGSDPDYYRKVYIKHNPFSNRCVTDPFTLATWFVDFDIQIDNLYWLPGESGKKSFIVDFVDDTEDEVNEYICFEIDEFLTDATVGSKNKHRMTILDNDVTGIEDMEIKDIKIYPSIADKFIFVKGIKNIKGVRITLNNILGQEMISLTPIANEIIQVDIESLQSGMYFINIHNDDTFFMKKFLKR